MYTLKILSAATLLSVSAAVHANNVEPHWILAFSAPNMHYSDFQRQEDAGTMHYIDVANVKHLPDGTIGVWEETFNAGKLGKLMDADPREAESCSLMGAGTRNHKR